MSELEHRELSGRVIEAAIAVHAALGPGFVESVYENALGVELAARGIAFEQRKNVPVLYRGKEVGLYRLDLVIEGVLLVELKAVKTIEDIIFRHRQITNACGWFAGGVDSEFRSDTAYY